MDFKTVDERWKVTSSDTHVFFQGGPFSQWFHAQMFGAMPLSVELPDAVVTVTEKGKTETRPLTAIFRFNTAEQYMMAGKAILFRDLETLEQIMAAKKPAEQKALGRQVRGYDDAVWQARAREIVTAGNLLKFAQNPDLREYLFATGDKHLVEGAHYDPVWGVALAWSDPAILDPANWRGTNWLGECLMAVRTELYGDLLKRLS